MLTFTAPVVPPSPTFGAGSAVVPSICRLNLPGSVVGFRSLTTSIVPVLRVLVIVQTTSSGCRPTMRGQRCRPSRMRRRSCRSACS